MKLLMGWYAAPEYSRTASTSSRVRNADDSGIETPCPRMRRSRMKSFTLCRKSVGAIPSFGSSRVPHETPGVQRAGPSTYSHSARIVYAVPRQSVHSMSRKAHSASKESSGLDSQSNPRTKDVRSPNSSIGIDVGTDSWESNAGSPSCRLASTCVAETTSSRCIGNEPPGACHAPASFTSLRRKSVFGGKMPVVADVITCQSHDGAFMGCV
jgi:hypothetical protein